ncbi:MAG: discoidin domain-containing protein, partial [Pirellulaceae bacterium]|nr:discoidin domain-containing protein [Pirellulaceae bacterium]
MKTAGGLRFCGLVLLTTLAIDAVSRAEEPAASSPPLQPAAITPQQIEADWLLQDVVRKLPPADPNTTQRAAVTTADDAAGAVDGVKDGTYGFHTAGDGTPWWQVDLGQTLPLGRIVIYNRCDGNVEDRAARIAVLLSDDGKAWQQVYQHDGTKFFGQTGGPPLTVDAAGKPARFVRLQQPAGQYFHLDEVEVYRADGKDNIALHRPADQSSVSQWSKPHAPVVAVAAAPTPAAQEPAYPVEEVLARGLALAADLRRLGTAVAPQEQILRETEQQLRDLGQNTPAAQRRELYLKARWAVRRMALANPLLDFDDLLFVKRVPGSFTHMSDQYYGWFSRPGGGVFILEDFKSDQPRLRCLTADFPPGTFLRPDLSHDGTRVLFGYCKYYPSLKDEPNKLDKNNVPEDAFFHVYEMNLDGSGVRRLTHGKYDDFDGRYLPNGEIVFLSTRRGHYIQCGSESGHASRDGALPDCYVRCGGGPSRPVAVYTLHVMTAEGENIRQISPFEMFEWTPSIDNDGRILYARWDYVDRYNMPYMSLWSTLPDGSNAQAIFGNYTVNPHCVFEARRIPDSRKMVFTASGHHAFTGGCLVLLDAHRAADGEAAMTRLTPEVCFPESEGWPQTYFGSPFPLSENHYLTAWSAQPLPPGTPHPDWGMPGPANDLGLYLFDAFGNLNLIYRDPEIGSETPLPIRRRVPERLVHQPVGGQDASEGRMVVADVYQGLADVPRGAIRQLRLVGVPVKTHPTMNYPPMGLTHDDPGKFVLGTVPVEPDGSAHFRVPAGVTFFVQALDEEGVAVQTMRSATYVQPGQTVTCIGCHEPRNTAPPNRPPLAAVRAPSRIEPGPGGSWPLHFDALVGPVLE